MCFVQRGSGQRLNSVGALTVSAHLLKHVTAAVVRHRSPCVRPPSSAGLSTCAHTSHDTHWASSGTGAKRDACKARQGAARRFVRRLSGSGIERSTGGTSLGDRRARESNPGGTHRNNRCWRATSEACLSILARRTWAWSGTCCRDRARRNERSRVPRNFGACVDSAHRSVIEPKHACKGETYSCLGLDVRTFAS